MFNIVSHTFSDSTLDVIYATIGSMVNVSISLKPNQRILPNSFVRNVSMHVTPKNCTVCAVSHMMRHSFIYAVISVKIGSMVDVLASCRARPTTSMNTYARIVNATIRSILPI